MAVNRFQKPSIRRLVKLDRLTLQTLKSLHRLIRIVGMFLQRRVDMLRLLNINPRGCADSLLYLGHGEVT